MRAPRQGARQVGHRAACSSADATQRRQKLWPQGPVNLRDAFHQISAARPLDARAKTRFVAAPPRNGSKSSSVHIAHSQWSRVSVLTSTPVEPVHHGAILEVSLLDE